MRRGFWEILKKVTVLRLDTKWDGWFLLACEALSRCRTRWGCRWKSQNRKIVSLSPYVEKPLNSKVIKSFVPELRSHYVFFEFRDSYVLSLWTFDMHFTHGRIWLWYTYSIQRVTRLVRNKCPCPMKNGIRLSKIKWKSKGLPDLQRQKRNMNC